MKYKAGDIIKILFNENDSEGFYEYFIVDNPRNKCFHLVNKDTFEVEFTGFLNKVNEQTKIFSNLSDISLMNIIINNYLYKKYPEERYKRIIIHTK